MIIIIIMNSNYVPLSRPLLYFQDVHCSQDTPCGWAVYTRFTRVVDYFMKNTCTCEAGRECIRVDDDVSVSAYVYKCRNVPSSRNGNDRGPAS